MSCGDGKREVRIKAHTQCRNASRKKTQAKQAPKQRPKRQKQKASKRTGSAPKKTLASMTLDELDETFLKKQISQSAYLGERERRYEAKKARRPKNFDSFEGRMRVREQRAKDAKRMRTKSGKRIGDVLRPDRS